MTKIATIDAFRDLVIAGDREGLCLLADSLDEQQRTDLATEVIAMASAINECWGGSGYKEDKIGDDPQGKRRDLLEAMCKVKYVDWRVPRWTVNLLVVAVCDQKTLQSPWRIGLSWLREDLSDMPERLLQILVGRKPKWLSSWIEKEWKDERPVPNSFVERGLIRAGLIPARCDSGYYSRFANDMMERYPSDAWETDKCKRKRLSIRERIEADPSFLEDEIWGIFECDSDILRHAHESWGKALVELSSAGKLDRDRLLRQSLQAMGLPFSASALNGVGKIHEMLAPSMEERAGLLGDYLTLFKTSQSTVLGHALKACEDLFNAKWLDAKMFLAALPHVFGIDKKTQPIKALKITQKLIKQDASLESPAAQAVVEGLLHPNIDVQAACLKLLGNMKSQAPEKVQARLNDLRDSLAASLKSEADALLQQTGSADGQNSAKAATKKKTSGVGALDKSVPSKSSTTKSSKADDGFEHLRTRATSLPDNIRSACCISTALEQLEAGKQLSIEAVRSHDIPRRDTSRQVAPLDSVDELIELVSATIESVNDVMDLERILDGISRFHQDRSDNFEVKTSSLKKRILKLSEPHTGKFLDRARSIGFTQLLMNWLELPEVSADEEIHWYRMRGWFLRERIWAIRRRLDDSCRESRYRVDPPVPMLALPTHEGGWIDPLALVTRLNQHYAEHRTLTDEFDLAQAMLRLTPDGRTAALKLLDKPDNYNGGYMLRYALGDNCELKSYGGWGAEAAQVAAVRARLAMDPDTTALLPIAKAHYRDDQSVMVDGAVTEDPTVPFSLAEVALSISPFPTQIIAPSNKYLWLDNWESITNPFDTHASCMAGHLRNLLEPEATWAYPACRLFVLAASDEQSDCRVYATDGILEAISRSLVQPSVLGKAIADALPAIKLNRLSKVLGEVAAESLLHRFLMAQSVQHSLLVLGTLPSDIHLLLSILLEAMTDLGLSIEETLAQQLKSLTGSSKAAKLAKQLVGLKGERERHTEVSSMLLETFVSRGERWHEVSQQKC